MKFDWFIAQDPPLSFWVMLGLMVATFLWAMATALRRRYRVAVLSAVLGIGIGLLILYWGWMGGFCVPPPGAGCA